MNVIIFGLTISPLLLSSIMMSEATLLYVFQPPSFMTIILAI